MVRIAGLMVIGRFFFSFFEFWVVEYVLDAGFFVSECVRCFGYFYGFTMFRAFGFWVGILMFVCGDIVIFVSLLDLCVFRFLFV